MQCPHCHHHTAHDTVLLECSHCGQVYERGPFEEIQHLAYLREWLEARRGQLGATTESILLAEVEARETALLDLLGIVIRPPEEIALELALVKAAQTQIQGWAQAKVISLAAARGLRVYLSKQAGRLKTELAGRPAQTDPPADLEVSAFALDALPLWEQEAVLEHREVRALQKHLETERAAHHTRLSEQLSLLEAALQHVPRWASVRVITQASAINLRRVLDSQAGKLRAELAGRPVEIEPPTDLQVITFALEALPSWSEALLSSDRSLLHRYLNERLAALRQPPPAPEPIPAIPVPQPAPPETVSPPVPEPAHTPAPPAPAVEPTPAAPPAPPPKPAAPPKPKRPPIDWGKIWEKAVEAAVSGALLRGLLYLGAFMIVIAATVLVVRFWDIFPQVVQLAFIAAVPTVFYLAGWGVRARLKLPQAGGVLTGVGALLVAVDFAAVYQFGGLAARVDGDAYWLGASLFCAILYAITAWRVSGEFFDYITLLGGSSALLALTRLLNLPLGWSVTSVTVSALGMTAGAVRLKEAREQLREFARASRYLPQVLIPASLVVALFIPPGLDPALAQTAAFLCAVLGYGLLAWRFPATVFAHAAVWSSIGALVYALQAATLPVEWYAAVTAALSIPYIAGGRLLAGQLREDYPKRRGYLAAIYLAGVGLLILSTLGGFATLIVNLWAGVITLALASLVLAGCAALFRRPVLVLAAGGLFIAPFSLAAWQWLGDYGVPQSLAWLAAAWTGLALAYLGVAVLLREAEKYAAWLNLWAHLLAPAAGVSLLFVYTPEADSHPTLAALGGVILVYLVSAMIHDSGRHPALSNPVTGLLKPFEAAAFLWPVGFLLPLWMAAAWRGSILVWEWAGAALAGLGLAYVALGSLLARRKAEYRFPFHVYAYALAAVGVLVAFPDKTALMTALYLAVAALGALAFVYRRVYEMALAALLFVWPFQLSLELSPLTPHGYSLAYALLASLGYIPLGIRLNRADRKYALPLYVTGYGLSVYAMTASLLGRFGAYPLDVPWVGAIVPLIITALYVFSVYYFRPLSTFNLQHPFAWAASLTFAITFGQTLTLLRVLPEYDAAAWMGLAFAYLLVERGLARVVKGDVWPRSFRLPLGLGAWVLAGLGLALTALPTVMAFSGDQGATHPSAGSGQAFGSASHLFPPILAQALAVGFVSLAARLYRSRWPLYLEPVLAFFPVTLFFIGYGERIFGVALTMVQYGIVWSGLGLAHLFWGVILDRNKTRYAHGLFLGGYALITFAVVWALYDRAALLWTLGLGIAAAAGSAIWVHFDRHRTWDDFVGLLFGEAEGTMRAVVRGAFLWLAAWPFPVWCVLLLGHLNVVAGFQWLGFALSSLAFVGAALWVRQFDRTYAWPFHTAAQFYTALGLLISVPFTGRALTGVVNLDTERLTGLSFILLQGLAVIFYATSAWLFRKRKIYYPFPYLAAGLAFFPYTLGWIFFGAQIISRPLTQAAEYGVAWSALAVALLGIALDRDQPRSRRGAAADPARRIRYAHGPYFVGYALAIFAVAWTYVRWTSATQSSFLWTLGLWIAIAVGSALLVHFGLHHTWDDLMRVLFGERKSTLRSAVRGAFLWLAAWPFPVWAVVLLWQLRVVTAFSWLGYSVSALAFLGLAVWLRRFERTYAWPLVTAGQVYTLLGLAQTVQASAFLLTGVQFLRGDPTWIDGITPQGKTILLGYILLQVTAVMFYAGSSWMSQRRKRLARFFSYMAAFLIFVPYTSSWITFRFSGLDFRLAYTWIGWAAALAAFGFGLDWAERRTTPGRRVGYAHGPYLAGYVLAGFALFWTLPAPLIHLYTFAGVILLAVLSHVAVHFGRHATFGDFINTTWRKGETAAKRAARTGFLFVAVYGFPLWLAEVLAYNQVPLAWRGLALALVAPIYVAFGLAVRAVKSEYAWPLFSAGYTLTAIGAMVAFDDLALAIYVLALNAVVYAASAYIFRQAFWLYLSNGLLPIIVLLTLHHNERLLAPWVAGIFMGLAFLYFGIGGWFNRQSVGRNAISSYALPFYAPAYLLSAVALAVASSERTLAITIYLAGVALYALSARVFREMVFLYPAAWLAAVPYYLGMTLILPETRWYGLGWLPLIVGCIALGRIAFHTRPFGSPPPDQPDAAFPLFTHPAMPFYLLAYALSVSMMTLSVVHPLPFTLAFAAGAVLYFASSALFRRPAWLYPGLLTAHLALLTYFTIEPSGSPVRYISLPFLGMTWAMALVGYGFSRRFPVTRQGQTSEVSTNFGSLLTPSWAQPFFIFAVLDVIVWQAVALYGFDTAIILAAGHAVLLGLFATLWLDTALAYGTLGFFLLAVGARLKWAALPLPEALAWVGGIGFGLYLLARLAERCATHPEGASHIRNSLAVWPEPLTRAGMFLSGLAVVATLPFVLSHTTAAAAALASAGALHLAIAYQGRYYRLGYIGMAMLQVAWALALIMQDVSQPQWYAVPAGLYFTAVGSLERRRKRGRFAAIVESFGLAVLLVTSFVQSLDGADGFPYFVLLLAEGLLVMWWGAAQRRKIPLFAGLAASALNVVAQAVVLVSVYEVNRWFIILGAGLLLVVVGVFVERQRERVIARAQEWRETLEMWE